MRRYIRLRWIGLLVLVVALFLTMSPVTQSQGEFAREAWGDQFGTLEDDRAHAAAVDGDGNVYPAGFTYGASPGQSSEVMGRAIFGTLVSDPETGRDSEAIVEGIDSRAVNKFNILTVKGDISLILRPNTSITSPTGMAGVIENARSGLPVRVAVLADLSPLDDQGVPTEEPVTALKLTVIQANATREHRRVVVIENQEGDILSVVDAQGSARDFAANPAFGLQRGDNLVVLVQRGEDQEDQIKAVVNATVVAERLRRLAEEAARESGDSFKSARLEALLENQLKDEEKRLLLTRYWAGGGVAGLVRESLASLAKEGVAAARERGRISGLDQTALDCVQNTLGRLPVSRADFSAEEQSQVDAECLEAPAAAPPTVEIIFPVPDAVVIAGSEIIIEVEADDDTQVTSVTGAVTDAGERTALVFAGVAEMKWRANPYTVLAGPTSFGDFISSTFPHAFTGAVTLDGRTAPDGTVVTAMIEGADDDVVSIEVTATDDQGNTAKATRGVKVSRPGRVEIVSGVVSSGRYFLLVGEPRGESFRGREIIFTLDDREVTETARWEGGGATVLNLSTARPEPLTILSIEPVEGPPGTKVSVTGQGFQAHLLLELEIGAIGVLAVITDGLGDFTTSFFVPSFLPIGVHAVAQVGETTASAAFTVTAPPPPEITLSISEGNPGDIVSLSGVGFIAFTQLSALHIGNLDVLPSPKPSTDGTGRFSVSFLVPSLPPEVYSVNAKVGETTALAAFEVLGVSVVPAAKAPVDALAELINNSDNLQRVWHFDPSKQSVAPDFGWFLYDPRPVFAAANLVDEIAGGKFYWINVKEAQTAILGGVSRSLFAGWNPITW